MPHFRCEIFDEISLKLLLNICSGAIISMFQKTVEREKPYSKEKIAKLKKLFKELEKFRGHPKVEAYTKKRMAELKA